jgi:hypothetical protein
MEVLRRNNLRVFGRDGSQPAGVPATVMAVHQLEVGGFIVDIHGFRSVRPSGGVSARIGSGGPSSSSRDARGGERPASALQPARPSVSTKPLGSIPLVDASTVAEKFSEAVRYPAGVATNV